MNSTKINAAHRFAVLVSRLSDPLQAIAQAIGDFMIELDGDAQAERAQAERDELAARRGGRRKVRQ